MQQTKDREMLGMEMARTRHPKGKWEVPPGVAWVGVHLAKNEIEVESEIKAQR